MNLVYLFSILLFTLFIIIISVRSYKKNYTITNTTEIDNKMIDEALNKWNNILNNSVKFEINIERKDINDDTRIASSSIDKFNYNYIKGTITVYPTFYIISDKEKISTFIHEIGHLLGIGTKWKNQEKLHKKDYPLTVREFNSKFNKNVEYIKVKNGHWDETELSDDIMYMNGGNQDTISSITLMNLRDIGWKI